jgi:carbon monoxide dehydrogenase subunit G
MAMIIKSHFSIDVPRDVAFKVLTDIELSAPCFPGAELGDKQPDGTYKGAFHVKLGPLSFRFAGKFGFLEMHPDTGTAKVSASGTDTKGRGGAQAIVDVSMAEVDGSTQVTILSDVTLSGSVAQYGRGTGMIQALSQQLINDFAKNLSAVMTESNAAAPVPTAAPTIAATTAAPTAASTDSVGATSATDAGATAADALAAAPANVPSPAAQAVPRPRAAPASLSGGSLIWRVFVNWLRSKFN